MAIGLPEWFVYFEKIKIKVYYHPNGSTVSFRNHILKTNQDQTGQGKKGNEGDKREIAKIQGKVVMGLRQAECLTLDHKIICLLNEISKLLVG